MNNSIRSQPPRRSAGLSLIEMMVALVVGMVVIGAVLAFTVATLRAYKENLQSTRLTQDLRTGMNLAVREIRRSGFDAASVGRIFSTTSPSSFSSVTVNAANNCVVYRYDRSVGSIGDNPAATEIRGLRLNTSTGTLQMDATSSTIDCTSSGSSWVDVSDPKVVNITQFQPTIRTCGFVVPLGTRVVGGNTIYDCAEGKTKNLLLTLTGALRSDATLVRSVVDSARVRTEDVQFTSYTSPNTCPPTPACSTL